MSDRVTLFVGVVVLAVVFMACGLWMESWCDEPNPHEIACVNSD